MLLAVSTFMDSMGLMLVANIGLCGGFLRMAGAWWQSSRHRRVIVPSTVLDAGVFILGLLCVRGLLKRHHHHGLHLVWVTDQGIYFDEVGEQRREDQEAPLDEASGGAGLASPLIGGASQRGDRRWLAAVWAAIRAPAGSHVHIGRAPYDGMMKAEPSDPGFEAAKLCDSRSVSADLLDLGAMEAGSEMEGFASSSGIHAMEENVENDAGVSRGEEGGWEAEGAANMFNVLMILSLFQ
eukprot:gene30971-38830_t